MPITLWPPSANLTNPDFGLEVALGNVAGYAKVNKFGKSFDCDSGVSTDLWDGANGVLSTDVWVAPTEARTHQIASSSIFDDGDPASIGMLTVRVYGLTDWDTAEVSEDITMNGTTDVPTVNKYVIIHRMVGLTFGALGTTGGNITATADTDSTITAAILAGASQTKMAIYGIPSTQTLQIKRLRMAVLSTTASTDVNAELLVKENADDSRSAFIGKEDFQFKDDAPMPPRNYEPPKSFIGPCIAKLQVVTDVANTDCIGYFDAYVVDN